MGDPVVPGEYGPDCGHCTPELFDEGKTPKYMNVVFRGIEKKWSEVADPPNGILFKVIQNVAQHCTWMDWWTIGDIDWTVWVKLNNFVYPDRWITEIYLSGDGLISGEAFYWWDEETCQIGNGEKKENMLNGISVHRYKGGTATTFWQPDDIPLELTEAYGFHPGKENLHDRLYLPDNKQCIKIANKIDKTNCLFSVDETQF